MRDACAPIAVLAVVALGVALFLDGFLLARLELSQVAEPPSSAAAPAPRFRRAVVVLVDALRSDFAFGERAAFDLHRRITAVHGDDVAIAAELLADPPTTTMQRLKALTTGGLPTFIDAGANFASAALDSDNLVLQLARAGKRVVLAGDDTWLSLFPTSFARAYAHSSFVVNDIDGNDDCVLAGLESELPTPPRVQQPDGARGGLRRFAHAARARDGSASLAELCDVSSGASSRGAGTAPGDWDVLVAHFLGIDHIGHTMHAEHEDMTRKQAQLAGALADVFDRLDDDTLLLVLGDHGMTQGGDHGGASPEEQSAALLAFAKRGLRPVPAVELARTCGAPHAEAPSGVRAGVRDVHVVARAAARDRDALLISDAPFARALASSPFAREFVLPRVAQIDVVPTLAQLLGVPIPFGSVGRVMPSLLLYHNATRAGGGGSNAAGADSDEAASLDAAVSRYCSSLCSNAEQLLTYTQAYARASEAFARDVDIASLLADGPSVRAESCSVCYDSSRDSTSRRTSCDALERLARLEQWAVALRVACQRMWTQFSEPAMLQGIALLAAALVLALTTCLRAAADLCAAGLASRVEAARGDGRRVLRVSLVVALLCAWLAAAGAAPSFVPASRWAREPVVLAACIGVAMLWMLAETLFGCAALWRACRAQGLVVPGLPALIGLALCVSAAVFDGLGPASNSFVESEVAVSQYLAAAVVLVCAWMCVAAGARMELGAAALLCAAVLRGAYVASGVSRRVLEAPPLSLGTVAALAAALACAVLLARADWGGWRRSEWFAGWALVNLALALAHWFARSWHVLAVACVVSTAALVHFLVIGARCASHSSALGRLCGRVLGADATADVASATALATLPVCVLLGAWSSTPAWLAVACVWWAQRWRSEPHAAQTAERGVLAVARGVAAVLVADHAFFATGHQSRFSALQFDAAFVISEHFSLLGSGAAVVLNTVLPHAWTAVLVVHGASGAPAERLALCWAAVAHGVLRVLLSAVFALVHRRHLMVWAVFAPKFVLGASCALVFLAVALVPLAWRRHA